MFLRDGRRHPPAGSGHLIARVLPQAERRPEAISGTVRRRKAIPYRRTVRPR
jgi:hypothetical protein